MKNKNLLSKKLELFYRDIQPKREQIAKKKNMRLQTDLELPQNDIKKLNKKYNIEMFSSLVRGGKAYAAEQNTREFKKPLFQSKRLHKTTSANGFDSRKLIRLTLENMDNVNLLKYGYALNAR